MPVLSGVEGRSPLVLLCLLNACGSEEILSREDPTESLPDLTAPMFAPDHLIDVQITMAPADWDTLRTQTRTLDVILGSNCLDSPPPSPFTYFQADVTIDGDAVPLVGVRKKGFLGSLSMDKPSLKIKFDEYLSSQTYSGLKGLTLNNAQQDPSYVKQCLGYGLFAEAGLPASRCNFATVSVNGTPLGVFVNVEAVGKSMLARHFVNNSGNLYEGQLSDFRDGWTNTFGLKTNEITPDRSDLEAVVTAMNAPDADLLATLEPLIDIDEFLTFWAMEVIIAHWDGYAGNTNNFFVYRDPLSGRFEFLPWGIDGILAGDPANAQAVQANGALAWRLYRLPDTQARYLARLRDLLDQAWNTGRLLAQLDDSQALLRPQFTGTAATDFDAQIQTVRDFVATRRASLLNAMAGGPPAWPNPLRDPPCLTEIGSLDTTFDTTWGTLGATDPWAAGTGTLSGDWNTTVWDVMRVGSTSGVDANAAPADQRPIVQTIAQLNASQGYDVVVAHIIINDPAAIQPNATIPLDMGNAWGALLYLDVTTNSWQIIGLLMNGSITFTDGATTNGAPMVGSVSSTVYKWIF